LIAALEAAAEGAIAEYERRSDASAWIAEQQRKFRAAADRAAGDPALARAIEIAAERTEKHATGEVQRLVGVTLRDTAATTRAVRVFRDRNLRLIRRLARSEVAALRRILERAERTGARVESVRKQILKGRITVVRSHADFLAQDQTLKLNGQITEVRQRQAGVKRYRWITSRDERVRPMHSDLDGKDFTWDDPPVTDRKGNRNHPGRDFRCRCTARPILVP
jgi:SPP1 gp7 family putative phage head morphogenesis protein